MTDRPRPDASSLTQTIIVQMVCCDQEITSLFACLVILSLAYLPSNLNWFLSSRIATVHSFPDFFESRRSVQPSCLLPTAVVSPITKQNQRDFFLITLIRLYIIMKVACQFTSSLDLRIDDKRYTNLA